MRAGRTVLAPDPELARALFAAVERAHAEAGELVWATPRVRDFSSWLREQHALRAEAELRCLSDLEERELWRAAVEESVYAERFVEPQGAARAAQRAARVMADYGIPAAALESVGGDEAEALADWRRRFEQRCAELGCLPGSALLRSFARPPEPIAWIESPAWRPLARRWLQQHAGPPLAAPAVGPPSRPVVFDAGNAAAELAALADWARRGLAADAQFRAWICVPDLRTRRAEIADAFDAALAPQRFALGDTLGQPAYALAGGPPLADYAPVRAALELLRVAGGLVTFDRFSACLRSPEYAATPADATRAAALDLALRRDAPSELRGGEWLRRAAHTLERRALARPSVLVHLDAALTLLDTGRGSQPMSRWASLWQQAFDAGPWVHRERWSSGEYQAATRLRELLAELAAGERVYGHRARAGAERILATAARDTPFQPQTGIPPIWVSGAWSDPWLAYDALWITGLAEDVWPAPVAPVPLLPLELQREFGVPTASAAGQLRTARELQERWAARARSWVVSFAKAKAARHSGLSPLVATIHSGAPGAGSQQGDGMPPVATATPQPHWRFALERAPVLERLDDERGPPLTATERTHGTQSLSAQSQCAFRGFALTRLGAEPLRRPTPGFSNEQRGELVHAALEHIWRQLQSSAQLAASPPAARLALVEQSVERALAAVCARRDPGERWRVRERRRLVTLLLAWLEVEGRRAPFTVEQLEPERVIRCAGLEFHVRVDRVDRLADGARVVIDYKSGTPTRDWRGERPDSLQLPVYALLYAQDLVAAAYGQVHARVCGFVAEAERDGVFAPASKATALEGCASFPELLAVWSRRIEAVAAALAAGGAEVAPTPQACRRCELQGFCRIPSDHG